MSVIVLVGVALGLLGGAYFLTKAPPPKEGERGGPGPSGGGPVAEPPPAPDAAVLREKVAAKLRERLVGWELELPADKPLEIAAIDVATEKRLTFELSPIAAGWYGLARSGREAEADNLVEAYVQGATGEGAGEDTAIDPETAKQALAVALVTEKKVPRRAITKHAGPVEAILVLRHAQGYDALVPEDLEALGMSAEEAFKLALANLKEDVEEGLRVTILGGTEAAPTAIQVAPDDPVAASYALLPAFAAKMFQKLGAKDVRYHLVSTGHLFVTAGGVELSSILDIEGERLEPEPVPPGDIAWR